MMCMSRRNEANQHSPVLLQVKAVNQGVSWMKALLTLSFEGEEPKWPQIEWHVTNDAARLPADHDRLAADEDQR